MSKKMMLGVVLSSLAITASADVLIQTPEEIVVVAINDQEIKKSIFGGTKNTYRLEAGTHQIAVKYQQFFEENYISHDIVRSGVVTLKTDNLIDQQNYELVLLNPPKNHDEAKKFAQQPSIALKDASGRIVAQQTGANTASQPLLANLFNKNNEIDVRGSVKAVSAPTVAAQAPQINTTIENSPIQALVKAQIAKDQQLIEIWKSANPQERQKFMAWLAEQASK